MRSLQRKNRSPGEPKTPSRNALVPAIKIFVTGLLLFLILDKVGIRVLLDRLVDVEPGFLILAFLLSIVFTLLKAYKWCYLVGLTEAPFPFLQAMQSYLVGMSIGLLTPGRIGEVGRVVYVKEGGRLRSVGMVGIDKLLDLAVVFGLACLGGFAVLNWKMGILFVAGFVLIILFLYYPRIPILWIKGIAARLPLLRKVNPILESIELLERRPLTLCFGMTGAAYSFVLAEFYLLLLGFGSISLKAVMFVFPVVMLTNILPITIGGLGVREGTAAVLFSLFHVPAAVAINAAFLIFFLNTLLPGLLGALLVVKHRSPEHNGGGRGPGFDGEGGAET